MIRVFTKTRHVVKIRNYLDEIGLPYEIFTRFNELPNNNSFSLGVSYCWSRKITDLTRPWINYHTAPLPAYPGGDPYTDGFKDRVLQWGCTVHYMNDEYDKGKSFYIYWDEDDTYLLHIRFQDRFIAVDDLSETDEFHKELDMWRIETIK